MRWEYGVGNMPDGSVSEIDELTEHVSGQPARRIALLFQWLFRTRSGLLWCWIVAASVAIAAAVGSHVLREPFMAQQDAVSPLVLASSLVALPCILLFLASGDNLTAGPRLALPMLSLLVLVLLAGASLVSHLGLWRLFDSDPDFGTAALNRMAFLAYLFVAFLPLLWNAAIFARHNAERNQGLAQARSADSPEERDAEAMGALVATLIVLSIGTLAFLAGNGGDQLSFKNSLGLILCGAVISVFAIVVFLDVLAESPPVRLVSHMLRHLSRRMRWLAAFYNLIDAGLVRLGAGIAGMEHRQTASRYAILVGTLLSLAIMGWCLPPPLGLLPVFVGFVIAISVSRIWSWVEEDRALAAMTDFSTTAPYRIGFREDYRDETLLGFIFVFALVPIAMMQAHEGKIFGDALFANAQQRPFLEWFGYFGVELAKAVPIVDWAEIYGVQQDGDMIGMLGVASKHTVFMARVMVDLVLIAALLQAIGIANRNRQQKRLYSAGHIKRLDPFVERNEIAKAIRFAHKRPNTAYRKDLTLAEAAALFDMSVLRRGDIVDFRRYDRDRLKAINSETSSPRIRAFIAALAHDGNWSLSPAIDRAKDVAASPRKNELELFKAFQRSVEEHDKNLHLMDADDIYVLLSQLRRTSGLKDFKQELIDWVVKLASPETALDHLLSVAVDEKSDDFQYTRNYASKAIRGFAHEVRRPEPIMDAIKRTQAATDAGRGPSKGEIERLLRLLRGILAELKSPKLDM